MWYTVCLCVFFFFFKQKTAYELRTSDWSSDVCSSDLPAIGQGGELATTRRVGHDEAARRCRRSLVHAADQRDRRQQGVVREPARERRVACRARGRVGDHDRSEEHTSELQSLMRISYAVFCLHKKTTGKHTH